MRMQQYEIYSIYDRKAKVFHTPVFCINVADCIRLHTIIFEGEQSMFSRFPDDYQIFKLGGFANDTGKIVAEEHAEYVCSAEDILQTKKGKTNENHNFKEGKWQKESSDEAGKKSSDGAALGEGS